MAKKQETKPEVAKEEPIVDNTVEKIKIKKKPTGKKFQQTDEVVKVDIKETEVKEEITKVEISDNPVEKSKEESEVPIIEEVTEINEVEVKLPKTPDLPEGLEKAVNFMKETGGDLNDYMQLNQDYSNWDDDDLLRKYYKETKPHLNDEEIGFLVEDNFSWDNDLDEEKDIKRKKLALKEQVASAKSHLDGLKSKYYEDLKMGSRLTEEQQVAIESFHKYKVESEEMQKVQDEAKKTFLTKTDEVFNEEFKGFEYQIGNRRFRFNVGDVDKVKTSQSDINNFVKKFLNENNQMDNATGYHKSLFTAMNSDAIANHFYEQGKADALKDSIAKSKNINMDPRQTHNEPIQSGMKVKVLDQTPDDFTSFKIRKKSK